MRRCLHNVQSISGLNLGDKVLSARRDNDRKENKEREWRVYYPKKRRN